MKTVRVKVEWVSKESGGRTQLPNSLTYSTVAKFKSEHEEWLKNAWSIVLNFDVAPKNQGKISYGTARFLVEHAPTEKLFVGNEFDLYEGNRMVAHVIIIN